METTINIYIYHHHHPASMSFPEFQTMNCALVLVANPIPAALRGVRLTPEPDACGGADGSPAEAAAKRDRGSVPSSMELSGSGAAELDEEEEEEVLPLRPPRRDFDSVTCGREGQGRGVTLGDVSEPKICALQGPNGTVSFNELLYCLYS